MPNKKKKGFKRCQSQPKPVTNVSTRRRPTTKRKQWTETQMLEALKSVQKDGLSGNMAADLHGVPRSTLKDRLSGRVRHGTKSGPKPYLSTEEESELASHLLQAADIGYGKTRRDVKGIVERHVRQKGTLKGTTISNGWWDKFLRRNPTLRLRSGDSTAHVRMDAINAENLRAYYDLLKSVYDEHGFDSHPEAIYNMDETGVPLEPRPPKVVAAKGKKKVRYCTSGQKSQITVIGCASATGQILPPYIIFAAKQLNALWTHDEVSGSRYAVSNKGWVDQELFCYWLKVHFIPNAISHRPLLLLLDGHSSHFEPNTIQHAQDNNIIIFCLPPHTTHECQPLDCSLFGPLKKHWQEACHNFYQCNPGKVISKINFNSVFRNAWLNAVTPANICSGFRKAGVYPFNPDAVEVPESSSSSSGSDDCGSHSGNSGNGGSSSSSSGNGGSNSSGSGDHSGSSSTHSGSTGSNVSGDDSRTGSNESDFDELGGDSCDLGNPFYDPSGCLSGSTDDPNEAVQNGEDQMFSLEEELRFSIRFDEGYDLFDPKYESWLRIHHPESASKAQIIQSPALVDPSRLQKTTDSSPCTSSLPKTTTSGLSKRSSPSMSGLSKSSSPSTSGFSKISTPSTSGLSKISSPSSSGLSKISSPSTSGPSKSSSPSMSGLSKSSTPSTSGLSKISSPSSSGLSKISSPSTSGPSKSSSPSMSGLSKSSTPSTSGLSKISSPSLSGLSKISSPSTSGPSKSSSPSMSGLSKSSSPSMSGLSKSNCSQKSAVFTTPKSSASSSSLTGSARRSPLSDLLNLPTVTTPAAPKTGKARVLTSAECLHLLKEKEEKKRLVAEEKERRKQERELRKQQKEAEQKRKAEEKARKLAEREAEKARRQAEKAQKEKKAEKAKDKAQKEKTKEKAGTKRQADGGISERACQRTKRKRLLGDMDENINTEVCCVCYGTYQEDVDTVRQWLECSCARWIHEDCIDDEDVDDSGRLCPLC